MQSNFAFLSPYWPTLAACGLEAEALFYADPHACLMKLRYFEEALVETVLRLEGRSIDGLTLEDMINALRQWAPTDLILAMHDLRKVGNLAAHEGCDYLEDAEEALKVAHRAASWAARKYHKVKGSTFVRPIAKTVLLWTYGLSLSHLSGQERLAVTETVERIQQDPVHGGIHYEHVPGRTDSNVRLVKVNDAFALAVLRGPRGDVVSVAWAARRPEALAYAQGIHIEIHPLTGALQVFTIPDWVVPADGEAAAPLFEAFSDEDLLWTGVPAPLLGAVRIIREVRDIDRFQEILPQEAYESLHALAAGRSLESVIDERLDGVERAGGSIDTRNFAAALARPDTRRRVIEIQGPEELREIMAAPLELWRVFLHPRQTQLATGHFDGPARVLGGAGTGKTIVLMHRARYLARHVFNGPDDKLLILTYTQTLAEDIRENLRNLCAGGPEFERITVQHLHGFSRDLLATHGHASPALLKEADEEAWKEAYENIETDFALRFFKSEYAEVIVAEGITDLPAYMASARDGRSVVLTDAQRLEIWKLFEAYKDALRQRGCLDFAGQIQLAGEILASLPQSPYRSVLVDETQDMGPIEFGMIRCLVAPGANDLFIVGDAYQKIFPRRLVLHQAGIEIGDRSRELVLNYRTTSQIRDWAVDMLDGQTVDDLNGGEASLEGYHSVRSGPAPEVRHFETLADELAYVVDHVRQLVEGGAEPASICVATFSNRNVPRYHDALEAHGIRATILKPYTEQETGVAVATMHRIKGLEFKHLVIAAVNHGDVPPVPPDDPIEDPLLRQTQRLLYTTAARARDSLLVSSYGRSSVLLKRHHEFSVRVPAAAVIEGTIIA